MWLEFKKLAWLAWHSALSAGSSTGISVFWLGFGVLVLGFFTTVGLEWVVRGCNMQALKQALKSWISWAGAILALSMGWLILFGWSVVMTIYNDHQYLASGKRALTLEVIHWKQLAEHPAHLPVQPETKRFRGSASKPFVAAAGQGQQPPPPQLASIRIASQDQIVSTDPNFPYGLHVVLQTDHDISPVSFLFDFDGPVGKLSAQTGEGMSAQMMGQGSPEGKPNLYVVEWKSPSFSPSASMNIDVYSKTYIKMRSFQQVPYQWPLPRR